jgi:hypothetical protein
MSDLKGCGSWQCFARDDRVGAKVQELQARVQELEAAVELAHEWYLRSDVDCPQLDNLATLLEKSDG